MVQRRTDAPMRTGEASRISQFTEVVGIKMGMSNLSVKARLFGTLSLLAAAMLVVGIVGLSRLQQADHQMDDIYGINFKSAVAVSKIAALNRDNIRALDVALMSRDPQLFAEFKNIQERNI